jgi:hypothetical protein
MPLELSGTSGINPSGTASFTLGSNALTVDPATGKVRAKSGFSVSDDSNHMALSVAANNDGFGLWFDTSGSTVNGSASKTSAYFTGDTNMVSFIGSGVARWSVSLNTGQFFSWLQRTSYDRAWDNYPSITVYNDTVNGPCSDFRIHGAPGINGGDFSVVTRSDGGFVTGSDARRKINVEPITGALDKVLKLCGTTFNIINREGNIDPYHPEKKMGWIAQDTIKIVPELVSFDKNSDTPNEHGWASAYSIDYQSAAPLLGEAIKELKGQLDIALKRIEELEAKLV